MFEDDNDPPRGYGNAPYSGWGWHDGNGGFSGYNSDGQYQDTADYGGLFPTNGNTFDGGG